MRILVTGSRTWKRADAIKAALICTALPAISRGEPVVIVHGDAKTGADRIARDWAIRRGGPVTHEPHPAWWDRSPRQAGLARNRAMVDLGADACLAFIDPCARVNCRLRDPDHGSHGASHCADLAERAGIPTTILRGGQ